MVKFESTDDSELSNVKVVAFRARMDAIRFAHLARGLQNVIFVVSVRP